MASIVDELSHLPFLSRVPRQELERAAPRFRAISLEPGEALWWQGAAVDELAIVLLGELAAEAGGKEVGRVRAPDIVGEAGAFVAGSTRNATLRAVRSTQVLCLGVADLRALRWQRGRLYDTLLELAQKALVRRVSATSARLASLVSGGTAAPSRKEPGALARLWRTLRPGGPTGPCPPAAAVLRSQAGLREMDEPTAAELAAAFVAEPFEEGQVIVLEGEPASAMYIVAEGEVDVLRNVGGDRAELLIRLGPGAQFGANSVVEPTPRTASCVAATAGWLLRMDREAFKALKGEARLLWRESILATLATQIRNANSALERALAQGPHPAQTLPPASRVARPRSAGEPPPARAAQPAGLADLLRASGYLETMPADEADLAEISFVIDEDHKRNMKNRGPRPG
jgi:CRP-like cAMP-binding protein